MATSSPEQSIHLKSPRSPRQLPQLPHLPQIPIGGQRSPTQLSVTKSPLVFEFPPEYYPETPNTNFDFEEFGRVNENDRPLRSPSYCIRQGCRSPKSPSLHSPGRNSPIFQFSESRKSLGKTMSYPPKSPISGPPIIPMRSPSSTSFGCKSAKLLDYRRNSCFGLSGSKSPMSPTIVACSSHGLCSPKHSEMNLEQQSQNSLSYKNGSRTSSLEGSFKEKSDSPVDKRNSKKGSHFNRSQGCLDEAGRGEEGGHGKGGRDIARKSTSDLTEIEDADTEVTLLSSPRRRGSMKGGLGKRAFRFLFVPAQPRLSLGETLLKRFIVNVSWVQVVLFGDDFRRLGKVCPGVRHE